MCTPSNFALPVVYTCSGATNLAQLANDIGLWLHQQGHARLSALAGLAGAQRLHIEALGNAPSVVAIDGCGQQCVRRCLANYQVSPRWHINLESIGIEMVEDSVCSLQETFKAMQHVSRCMNLDTDGHFSDHLKTPGGTSA